MLTWMLALCFHISVWAQLSACRTWNLEQHKQHRNELARHGCWRSVLKRHSCVHEEHGKQVLLRAFCKARSKMLQTTSVEVGMMCSRMHNVATYCTARAERSIQNFRFSRHLLKRTQYLRKKSKRQPLQSNSKNTKPMHATRF